MIYQVMHAGEVIGSTTLAERDVSMGVAFGELVPTAAYESVRAVFRLFAEAGLAERNSIDEEKLARYYRACDALHLSIRREDGVPIPTEWIHVVDWSTIGIDQPLEIEAKLLDPSSLSGQ